MTVGAPQQSTKSFTSPAGVPIKKTPPIIDIIQENVPKETPIVKPEEQQEVIAVVQESETIEEPQTESSIEIETSIEPESVQIETVTTPEISNSSVEIESVQLDPIVPVESIVSSSNELKTEEDNSFAFHWGNLFKEYFTRIPIIFFPLKEYIPQLKENIIYVDLKNENQKEHFEPKIREILSYLRTHYSDLIEDIVVNVDETIVTRKVIYDTADKMKNLNEQNINFEEFSNILNLKVKE